MRKKRAQVKTEVEVTLKSEEEEGKETEEEEEICIDWTLELLEKSGWSLEECSRKP